MRTSKQNKQIFAYTSILSLFAIYAYLRLFPIAHAFWLSFTNKDLFKRASEFIGLENYRRLLGGDNNFILSLTNTLLFALFTVTLSLIIAFAISLILYRRKIFAAGSIQSLIFLPVVISVVPCAIIWKWIYDPQFGVLNWLLSFVGLSPVGWLVDANWSMFSVIVFVIWKWLGYYMVIFLVGLANIPIEYIECATIDGAGESRMIRNIIVPLMGPILFFATTLATFRSFTFFSEIYVMTTGSQGAPGNLVKVLTYDIYERALLFGKVGEANAEAVLLFLLLLVFTVAQVRLNRRRASL